jgi:hypothetical protein
MQHACKRPPPIDARPNAPCVVARADWVSGWAVGLDCAPAVEATPPLFMYKHASLTQLPGPPQSQLMPPTGPSPAPLSWGASGDELQRIAARPPASPHMFLSRESAFEFRFPPLLTT